MENTTESTWNGTGAWSDRHNELTHGSEELGRIQPMDSPTKTAASLESSSQI